MKLNHQNSIFPSRSRNESSLISAGARWMLLAMLGISVSLSSGTTTVAQEAPPTEQEEEQEKDYSKKPDSKKKADEKKEDKKDSDDKKSEDKKSEKKQEDKDEKKSDGKDAEKDDNGDAKPSSRSSSSRNSRRRVSRRTENSRQAASFLKVFEPVVSATVKATVKVKSNKSVVALGAVVSTDGYVLTKHSELKRPITVMLSNGDEVPATVFGVHTDSDLALLKIDVPSKNLAAVRWATDNDVDVGNWLATVSDSTTPLAVGVVGVRARFIRPQSGFMGVNLGQTRKGVRITNVSKDSPAEKGGLEVGDIVTKVNGDSYLTIVELSTKIKSFPPGEEVRLTVLRDDREIFLTVILGEERALNPNFARSNQQNTMGGNKLSNRRQNFKLAVQHDAVLKPEQCGGPVVNLDGEVVGINIARQGRVSSLMLPTSLVLPIVAELKTGKLNPVLVNREKIDEISKKLEELTTIVNRSPVNDDDLEKEVKSLNKKEKELRKELEETLQARIRAEIEFEQASKEYKSAKAEVERLKKMREELTMGAKK